MVLEIKVIRNIQALGKLASVKSHVLHHLQELTVTHECTHINKTKEQPQSRKPQMVKLQRVEKRGMAGDASAAL